MPALIPSLLLSATIVPSLAISWTSAAHAQLVPGLPVYSGDGSVDTSWTVRGIQPQIWEIEMDTDLPNWAGGFLGVDARGRVWASWIKTESTDGGWVDHAFVGRFGDEGLEETLPVMSAPQSEHWTYSIAVGQERLWCAVREHSPDLQDKLRVFPCDMPEVVSLHELPISTLRTDAIQRWRLQFMDGELVVIENMEDGLQVLNLRSGSLGTVFNWNIANNPFEHTMPFQVVEVGSTTAILSNGWLFVDDRESSRSYYTLLSVLREGRWKTEPMLSFTYVFDETIPFSDPVQHTVLDRHIPESYAVAGDIGTDGHALVYMPFLEDDDPQYWGSESIGLGGGWETKFFSFSSRPKILVFEAATLDTVEEWTLGYEERRELIFPPETFLAATTGHNGRVAVAVARSTESAWEAYDPPTYLDLWILDKRSWYGPYRVGKIQLSAADYLYFLLGQIPFDVVVDGDGSYWFTWFTWNQGGRLVVAQLASEDLRLGDAPTDVARIEQPSPQVFSLAQNTPNPFNAETVIEASTLSARARIDILNLQGQKVRSLPLTPGSNRVIWDGADDSGRHVASGVYIYRLQEGAQTRSSRRMALIR